MKPVPLRSIPPRFAALYGAGVFVLIFALHYDILRIGFWADDFVFLRDVPPFSFGDLPSLVDPLFGWFYRPVFLVAFALMRRVFGDNAVMFHAVSLVLHAVNITLLGALAWRVSQERIVAVLAGALFVFHPLVRPQVNATTNDLGISAVAWISSGSTLLAGFFYLLTLHGWLSWRHAPRRFVYIGTLLCFALSLGSKEDALSLPLALVICELLLCPGTQWRRRWLYIVPFVAVGSSYLVLDAVAYLYYKTLTPQAGMLRTNDFAGRLTHVLNFYVHMVPNVYSSVQPLINLIFIGAVGWVASCTSRPLRAAWWWSLVVALPAPLAAGSHAYANRFFYVPMLAMTLFSVMAGAAWLRAQRLEVRTLGAIWLSLFVGTLIPLHIEDPINALGIALGMILLASVLYRYRLLTLYQAIPVVLVLLAGQLKVLGPDVPVGTWELIAAGIALALLSRLAACREQSHWYAIPIVLCLSSLPLLIYPLLLVLLVVTEHQKVLDKLKPQRIGEIKSGLT